MARVKVEVPIEETPNHSEQAATKKHADSFPNPSTPIHAGKAKSFKKTLYIIAAILSVLFVMNLISERNQLKKELSSTPTSQKAEDIVALLAKSIELPDDDVPQIRTIEDASKFAQQNPSLADIKNGDQLLFFTKTQRVVVYRPSTKKAIVVVTLAQPTSEPATLNTQ